jgi:hypothetical protein
MNHWNTRLRCSCSELCCRIWLLNHRRLNYLFVSVWTIETQPKQSLEFFSLNLVFVGQLNNIIPPNCQLFPECSHISISKKVDWNHPTSKPSSKSLLLPQKNYNDQLWPHYVSSRSRCYSTFAFHFTIDIQSSHVLWPSSLWRRIKIMLMKYW